MAAPFREPRLEESEVSELAQLVARGALDIRPQMRRARPDLLAVGRQRVVIELAIKLPEEGKKGAAQVPPAPLQTMFAIDIAPYICRSSRVAFDGGQTESLVTS